MLRENYFTRTQMVVMALVLPVWCAWGCFVVAGMFGFARNTEPGGVTGYLRGGAILILRLPITTAPVEEIAVYEDGRVIRGFPKGAYNNGRRVPVTREQWEAADGLRALWCRTPPQFDTPRAGALEYQVGLRCTMFNLKEVRIPEDQLPPALDVLVHIEPLAR